MSLLQKWCIFNVKKLAHFIEVNINLAYLIMTYPGSSYYIYSDDVRIKYVELQWDIMKNVQYTG